MSRVNQRSFAGGVMSPAMMARYDDIKYQTGLAECRNFICLPQGPVQNRTGTEYVNEVKYSNRATRLVAFTYSITQTMVLEFGHKYVRFHTMGQTLMKNGAPYEVATPYVAADLPELCFCQSSDVMTITHQNYAPRELRRYGVTDWRLAKISFEPALAAPTGVTVTRTKSEDEDPNEDKYTFEYKVTALNADKTEESDPSSVASCVVNLYQTGTFATISWNAVAGASFYRVYKNQGGLFGFIGDTSGTSIVDDGIAPETGTTPPYRYGATTVPGGVITGLTVNAGGSGYDAWTNGITAQSSTHWITADGSTDNRNWGGASPTPGCWESSQGTPVLAAEVVDLSGSGSGGAVAITTTSGSYQYEVESGDSSDYVTYYTTTVTGFSITSRGHDYRQPAIKVTATMYGGIPTRVRYIELDSTTSSGATITITDTSGRGATATPNVVNGSIVSATVTNGGSGYSQSPTVTVNSTSGSGASIAAIVSQASTAGGLFGSAGNYPRCSGYFEQRRLFASTINDPQRIWMTKTGTGKTMSYCLPSQPDDAINFQVASQENNPIMHVVSLSWLIMLTGAGEWRVGTLNSDALTPESISVRPQSNVGASSVQPVIVNNALLYAAARGGHLREFSYSSDAGGYITGDLSLRAAHLFDGLTIKRMAFCKAPHPIVWCVSSNGRLLGLTYVPEQKIGAWHEHVTDGTFESCCAVAEGNEDVLYVVVRRLIDGAYKRYVERLSERSKGIFADCAGVYEGTATTTVSGLTWLEGKTVSILADGAVENPQTVTNGQLHFEFPVKKVIVGLPYTSDLMTMPASVQSRDGSLAHGRKKNVGEVWTRLYASSGVWLGPDYEHMVEIKQRTVEPMGTPPSYLTGEYSAVIPGVWTQDGQICLRQADPLPITLVGLTADMKL